MFYKKSIIYTCIFMLISLLLGGCAEDRSYSVRVCGYSDSIPEADIRMEFTSWSENEYSNLFADKESEISVGNMTFSGRYKASYVNSYEYFPTHVYIDGNGNKLETDGSGKLTAYHFGFPDEKPDTEDRITESESIECASSFLGNIVNVDDYTATSTYSESFDLYTVRFEKHIGEVALADSATIHVNSDGSIYSYSSTMLGKMPADTTVGFDMSKVRKSVDARLDKIFADAKDKYDRVEYNNYNYILTQTSQTQYALVCSVEVTCITDYEDLYESKSALIKFVIQ